MSEIIKTRTIRPSSRDVSSTSYKIDTSKVGARDVLKVIITHESNQFKATFIFNGSDVSGRKSIHFTPREINNIITIEWKGIRPAGSAVSAASNNDTNNVKSINGTKAVQSEIKSIVVHKDNLKKGLPCVISEKCKVLILGTMPGEESLKKQEYYGNSRNLFWEFVENALDISFPVDYGKKISLLKSKEIALWDVCSSCVRDGSLDSNILEIIPNDLEGLIKRHPELKLVAFNGEKAAKLFAKYFGNESKTDILVLPSSSPANVGIPKADKQKKWKKLQAYLN